MPETQPAPALDKETTAALTLFNEYLDADRERTLREKRLKKAEKAKNDAAAEVKRVTKQGSVEKTTAAEANYRKAAETWRNLRDGVEPNPTPDDSAPNDSASDDSEPSEQELSE